jgi:plasmid stability protein
MCGLQRRSVPTRKTGKQPRPDDWVDELIAMTRPGVDMVLWDERNEALDHYRVNVPDESVKEVLRETAEAHGRTVEEELSALVEKTYVPKARKAGTGESSIQKLIRLGRGLDVQVPPRTAEDYEPPQLG